MSIQIFSRRSASETDLALRRKCESLRILRVADVEPSAVAGVSGFLLASSDQMRRAGHHVDLWFRPQLLPRLRSPFARRLILPWFLCVKVLIQALRGRRPDVVEISGAHAAPYALLARLWSRAPRALVLSHGLEERMWQAERRWLQLRGRKPKIRTRVLYPLTVVLQSKLAIRWASLVLVLSSEDREFLIATKQATPDRIRSVFGGVDEGLLESSGAQTGEPRVLFVGNWIDRKGVEELVHAWETVRQSFPDASLTVAGVGTGGRAESDLAGLKSVNIVPTVSRTELAGLLRQHSIFVLPSWFEGMPLSLIEAAGSGLACIACSVSGNLDLFRGSDPEADGGLLVPPHDPDALAEALTKLLSNPEMRQRLGKAGSIRAREFTWNKNAQRTLDAYQLALVVGRS